MMKGEGEGTGAGAGARVGVGPDEQPITVLQTTHSEVGPHGCPPADAFTSTVLVRHWVPICSHGALHGEKSDQSDRTHATGQGAVLQDRLSDGGTEHEPP